MGFVVSYSVQVTTDSHMLNISVPDEYAAYDCLRAGLAFDKVTIESVDEIYRYPDIGVTAWKILGHKVVDTCTVGEYEVIPCRMVALTQSSRHFQE